MQKAPRDGVTFGIQGEVDAVAIRGQAANGTIRPDHSEELALDVVNGNAVPRVAVAPAMFIADHPTDGALILNMFCEGQSMRATARLTDVSFNTVAKLLIDAGKVCADLHDEMVQDVTASRIQCD